MKIKLVLALTLILLLGLTAVPAFAAPTISELERQLDSAVGSERVTLLNTLAELLIEKDPEQALMYAQEALPLSEDLKLPKAAADSLNNIGYALFRMSAYQEAVGQFQAAIAIAGPEGYEKGTAFGRNGYGLVWAALDDYSRALDDFNTARQLFIHAGYTQGEAYTLNNIGSVYESSGAYDKALEAYLAALRINETLNNQDEMATNYSNIGSVNSKQKNFEAAFSFYSKALTIYEEAGNDMGRADTQMNLGKFFQNFGYADTAIGFFNKSLNLATALDSKVRIASALNALAYASELKKEYSKALDYYSQGVQLGEAIGDDEIAINAWNNIGTVHHTTGDLQTALDNHIRAFEASKAITYEAGLKSSLKNIANDYQAMGRYQDANHYFILYNELRDALNEREQSRNFASAQTLYETEKKDEQIAIQQAEITEKERRTRILLGIIAAVLLFLAVTATQALIISKEKKKSEALLLNILPAKVAEDLKRTGHTEPVRFDAVTILFSDIVGFTQISSTMDPHVLISELNELFTAFDGIMDKYHCQRIKTIGDAYFAVCGLPEPDPDHTANIVSAAREMLLYLEKRNLEKGSTWKIRIGVHTGPVVGGVVGVKKYIYDIFGDTVNTASRMESNGAPMRINVSEATHNILGNAYTYEEREPLPVKGKGIYKMYFLN